MREDAIVQRGSQLGDVFGRRSILQALDDRRVVVVLKLSLRGEPESYCLLRYTVDEVWDDTRNSGNSHHQPPGRLRATGRTERELRTTLRFAFLDSISQRSASARSTSR